MACSPENCLHNYGVSNAGTLKAVMEVLFHGVRSGKSACTTKAVCHDSRYQSNAERTSELIRSKLAFLVGTPENMISSSPASKY